ncbi:MAG: hypothetical protein HY508_03965 [Acidobacteria bacterium]|nr:hypothetical protein [Acidobacteriota bacterium]
MASLMRAATAMALAFMFVVPSTALAQSNDPKKPENARFGNPTNTARQLQDLFYGVIKSVDKKEMVLEKTKFGVDQTVVLTEKTKFVQDGKPGKAEDLKVGDQVWIRTKNEKKTGDMIAEVVMSGVIAPTIRK